MRKPLSSASCPLTDVCVSFLEGEYLDKTRNTVALSDLPDGKAWYEYLVRTQTTTDLTPEEIFQLGMR